MWGCKSSCYNTPDTTAESNVPGSSVSVIYTAATGQHIQTLIGENDHTSNSNFRKFTTSVVPLHLQVSVQTKNKINQEQYVDFGTLLPNQNDHSEMNDLHLKVKFAAGDPKILFEKQTKKKNY